MLAKVFSAILVGIDAKPCEVEVDVPRLGMEKTIIVGLAQTAVKESAERVRRACLNSGFPFPQGPVLVNLAPADVKKEGPALDLPIAVGVLRAQGAVNTQTHEQFLLAGELALDGSLRSIKGALSIAMLAKETGKRGVIVPTANAREAAVVEGIDVIAVSTLAEAAEFLNGQSDLEPYRLTGDDFRASNLSHVADFVEVRGQESVKRAITLSAAGSHNILMLGPPGTGKTMLAKRMPGILPPLSREESLEVTRIYSALGLLPQGVALLDQRPVRMPHHSATGQAIVGGGSIPKPGEVSLAHHGVLFLDELPEFSRFVLEMLRQPLESGDVTIARVHGSLQFPAQFMLVAAMNPTQKGSSPDDPRARNKYLDKLSGPLLDRIDMHVEVPAVPYHELVGKKPGTDTATMRQQVTAARELQRQRTGSAVPNSRMSSDQMKRFADLDEPCLLLMKQAMEELGLSARAYDKVRRVGRTIADLDSSADIREEHLAEAIQYRLLDRTY